MRLDHVGAGALAHGVVAPARDAAIFAYLQLAAAAAQTPGRLRLAGLDPARRYVVRVLDVGAAPTTQQLQAPPWMARGVRLSGAALMGVGLPMPVLHPEQALLLSIRVNT